MAKFRRQHEANEKRGAMISRMARLTALVIALLVLAVLWYRNTGSLSVQDEQETGTPPSGLDFLPAVTSGQLIHHSNFSLSYREDLEQAEWVAYELTVQELNAPRVPREDYFREDDLVRSGSAHHRDYSGSGFTRGHLAPAADMAFSSQAMKESFYMSNISPQVRAFNGGIWRELEEQTRDWARKNKHLYIVSGPVFDKARERPIGGNQVAVPTHFYKVLLDFREPEKKAIAFLIPNALSEFPLEDYAVTVDSVEAVTGLDFFATLEDPQLVQLEGQFDLRKWPVNRNRYQRRVNEWNKR